MNVQAAARPGTVSSALARDRLGVPAVLAFLLAGVAPLTVAAGRQFDMQYAALLDVWRSAVTRLPNAGAKSDGASPP